MYYKNLTYHIPNLSLILLLNKKGKYIFLLVTMLCFFWMRLICITFNFAMRQVEIHSSGCKIYLILYSRGTILEFNPLMTQISAQFSTEGCLWRLVYSSVDKEGYCILYRRRRRDSIYYYRHIQHFHKPNEKSFWYIFKN